MIITYKILFRYTSLDPGRFFTLDRTGVNLRPFQGGGLLRNYLSAHVVPYYNALPADVKVPRALNRFTTYIETRLELEGIFNDI